jgi:3D (Asp-Asp-Asp) domain-containing protein
MEEPLTADEAPLLTPDDMPPPETPPPVAPSRSRTIAITESGNAVPLAYSSPVAPGGGSIPAVRAGGGRSLGTFRNTYYDFPSEGAFSGKATTLYDRECKAIASVASGFYEAVCVQGSGTLKRGGTVSFARRDCECADICPRTGQKICFDQLDPKSFPWGRGATGKAITPLLTVAVDSDVIPLGTGLYVPELEGLPRDGSGTSTHDGCFVAQDRGLRVKGNHIDVFTGDPSVTKLWNQRVPSNRGVTVVLDSPRCARANLP